ncbi:CHC2 zinc finger domain-containing protein [Mycobacteroides abscessus]|uniref:CHC2 zinc finger domain-containing protein n=1 Tax=Mycobacteroides abscessus TaxID=36809 RepID=UPI0033146EEF
MQQTSWAHPRRRADSRADKGLLVKSTRSKGPRSLAITAVILYYYPDWSPPNPGPGWRRCLCPFHGDETPSGAVHYGYDAFSCLACGTKGDAIAIVKAREGVNYSEAKRRIQEILEGGDGEVPPVVQGQSSRRVFGESGSNSTGDSGRTGRQSILPTRVRRRPFGGT